MRLERGARTGDDGLFGEGLHQRDLLQPGFKVEWQAELGMEECTPPTSITAASRAESPPFRSETV